MMQQSQQSLCYNNEQVKTLPAPGIQSNEVHVDVARASSIRFCKGAQP